MRWVTPANQAVALAAALFALCTTRAQADGDQPSLTKTPTVQTNDVFNWVRIKYDSIGGRNEAWYFFEGRIWQRWETDYPRAGKNLMIRLAELTALKVNPEPLVIRLTDESLFTHPFIYMSDVGWMTLSDPELVALRKYLDTGGFLWVDDFWGQAEWNNWEQITAQFASEWKWTNIPTNHSILKAVYPLASCPQVPARGFYVRTGSHWDPHWLHREPNGGEEDMKHVHFKGLFDEHGRLRAIATHNTDIADGWEREGEGKDFFDKFSVNSYALAINVITYVMSH